MSPDSDFFEEDEPVERVREAFERGVKGLTRRPSAGQTEKLWAHMDLQVLPPAHGWTVYLDVPGIELLTPRDEAPTATVRI